MSRPVAILGVPNIAESWALRAGSEVYAAANLGNQFLGSVWRSASPASGAVATTWESHAWVEAAGNATDGVQLQAVALRAIRTFDDSAGNYGTLRWRVRAYVGTSVLGSLVRPAPVTLTNVTNLSGSISAIQDSPYAPDGTWLTASSLASDTAVRVTFQPAIDGGALPLRSGAGLQTVNLWLRKSGAAGTNPTATVKLYDNTTLVATLGTTTISSSTGQFVQHTFNASLLPTMNPVIGVEGTAGSAHTVEPGAIELVLEHSDYDYDSGTLTPVADANGKVHQLDHILPAAVDLSVGGASASLLIDFLGLGTTAYLQAGALIFGDTIGPSGTDILPGWSLKRVDPSTITTSLGGQEWATVRPSYRLLNFRLGNMTEAEAYQGFFATLDATKGNTKAFVVYPQPDNAAQFYNQAIFGCLREIEAVEHAGWAGGQHRYARTFNVKELI